MSTNRIDLGNAERHLLALDSEELQVLVDLLDFHHDDPEDGVPYNRAAYATLAAKAKQQDVVR